ncbi:UNVERIFIED_CONTAM: hypothetical protein FKN15_031663 [Acipenser sinensis]
MEVEVDTKANGEDCLNKVCRKLGIIEVDYFGLQFSGSKGESLWLNLRNRISQQVDSPAPCRLKLRVKFFVEPHLIQQEQTRCDTVTNAVMMQYSRDFKGHLASLFLNENINLGKKYVFDIKRTSKEVYDHTRRALYNAGIVDFVSRRDSSSQISPLKSSESNLNCASCEGLSCQQSKALQDKLQKLKEAMLCMVCCEKEINSAFCPCGHMVCCKSCAAQLQIKSNITMGLEIFCEALLGTFPLTRKMTSMTRKDERSCLMQQPRSGLAHEYSSVKIKSGIRSPNCRVYKYRKPNVVKLDFSSNVFPFVLHHLAVRCGTVMLTFRSQLKRNFKISWNLNYKCSVITDITISIIVEHTQISLYFYQSTRYHVQVQNMVYAGCGNLIRKRAVGENP